MKRISWIFSLLLANFFTQAQDSWKIKLNTKAILSSNAENEAANTKKVTSSEFDKKGDLEILYKEESAKEGWSRSLLFFDENDNELLRKDSITTNTRINNTSLKNLVADKKKLKIYTISLPTDPNMAAAIRVRRVHLCTLELQ